ncbi:MAG: hypothetical protein K0R39_1515 [Symbiobacteriaceae bacterium]|jgi:hypothetical protein|nr:hypothetical protein [Symbiobacteriaceae bacterium]
MNRLRKLPAEFLAGMVTGLALALWIALYIQH